MKLLSVAIPSYNSEAYLSVCVESLLKGGDEVELLIVNDGSKDRTQEIAEKYQADYPNIVKVINKENGGHGSAVNAGLAAATGLYFKVVDSDDWVQEEAYQAILSSLRQFKKMEAEERPQVLVSNYVYEKDGKKNKRIMSYTSLFPENKVFGWAEMGIFLKGNYMMMHALMYDTEFLRSTGLVLPEHTFYVDNLFASVPLQYAERLFYKNVDFYRYWIGRVDQSVQEGTMIKRLDQQIRVNQLMFDQIDFLNLKEPKQAQYLYNYIEIVTGVSNILPMISGAESDKQKIDAFWAWLEQTHPEKYQSMRKGMVGRAFHLPSTLSKGLCLSIYKIAQKLYGFN